MTTEIHVTSSGYDKSQLSAELRWLGKNGTTSEPRRLQQGWTITRFDADGCAVSQRIEWRDIPLYLED